MDHASCRAFNIQWLGVMSERSASPITTFGACVSNLPPWPDPVAALSQDSG
jgi:hypothetical protein